MFGTGLVAGPAHAANSDVAPCTAAQLSGEIVFGGAAAGNRYARLVVTNQAETCTLFGHSGLQLTAVDGRSLLTLANPRDAAEPSLVTLGPAGQATADLHWIVGPCFTGGDDGTPESRPAAITVTPPGETAGFTLPWTLGAVCGEPEGPARIDISAFRAS